MDEYFQLFDKMIANKNTTQSMEKELVGLIETLFEDLSTCHNTISTLQTQLNTLADSDKFGITSKYHNLKKAYEELKRDNEALRTETSTWTLKEEELKQQHSENLQQIETRHREELERKDYELRGTVKSLEDKNEDLLNQIHANESVAALQCDEFNSRLKRQLDETVQKLQDNLNTSNILRGELRKVKEQFSNYQLTSTEKIAELRRKLEKGTPVKKIVDPSPKSYSSIERELLMEDVETPEYTEDTSNSNVYPFRTGEVAKSAPPTIYRGSTRYVDSGNNRRAYPPLMELRSNGPKGRHFDYSNGEQDKEGGDKNNKRPVVVKKRKLFDPNDLSYLDGLGIN